MKLQYGILGMVLVSGASFAHNHEEVAEGITVGGYVDARYTWMNGDKDAGEGMSMFNLPEGALQAGKRVGAANVFVEAGFESATDWEVAVAQAYVSHKTDAGLEWKAGVFDYIYGWYSNQSSRNMLSTSGILHSDAHHSGLLFGYNFSDMMSLHLVVDANNNASERTPAANGNMDSPGFGVKLDSKMDAFTLGLGYYMIKETAEGDSMWDLDVVAGTKFADYDFKATFIMGKETADFNSMGFGAEIGGSVTDSVTAAARVEWMKDADESTMLAFAVGPQFNLEKGFDVKLDLSYAKAGGEANEGAEAETTINVAAIYAF